jgi:crossover junction endodeoxyribonuclease RuvC
LQERSEKSKIKREQAASHGMEKIILGIDPGTNVMGYGLIAVDGSKHRLLEMKALNLKKIKEPMERLQMIFEETTSLILQYQPAEAAIEEPFFGKNVQSMLKLGRAQGMAIAAAIQQQVPVFQYAPRKVKQSITGNGASSKEQVAAMLQRLLAIQELPGLLDATDGLAVAVCHFYQNKFTTGSRQKFNSWEAFLTNNPGRVK